MKRPIKFRGVTDDGNNTVVTGTAIYVTNAKRVDIAGCGGGWHRVKPESVAQFIGRDALGNEVYEGDVLSLDYGDYHLEYTAQFAACARNEEQGIYQPDLSKLTLAR